MKTLLIRHDIELLPKPNEYHLIQDDVAPPAVLTTGAFLLAFRGDRLLMTRLAARDWDIPGGHVDAGETPEETARRELYEEAGATVGIVRVIGYDKFIVHAAAPEGYRYPHPVSYQLFYWGRITLLDPFTPTKEALERRLFAPEEARRLTWTGANPELYAAAPAMTHHASESPGA